jgi:PAS domain S-box-containing protein
MGGTVRVLHVDDDAPFASVAADAIERGRDRFEVVTETSGRDALDRLESGEPRIDCVVSDYEMPELDGLELLRAVRERRPRLPFILFTGAGNEGIASEAISAGVTDYMEKQVDPEQYDLLANRIENAVEQYRDVRRRAEAMAASMDGMAILDDDGEYIYVNEAHAAVYGYDDPDAFRGEDWRTCYGDAELRRFEEEVMPTLFETGEWRGEATGLRADGSTFPQELSLTTMADGGIVCVVRDISGRHERERALAQRREALQRVYEVVADPELSFDEQMDELLEVVRATIGTEFATFSHVRGGEYVFEAVAAADGEHIEAGDVESLSNLPFCERVVETEQSLVVEDVDSDAPELAGAPFGISCYIGAPVTVEDDVYGTFCFYDREADAAAFSDWTVAFVELLSNWVGAEYTRQKTLSRLEQQNERLEKFASVVSHDLQNPLNTLLGSLQLAEQTGERAHFERCEAAIERMEDRVEGLLSLARAGEVDDDLASVPLGRVAEECWTTAPTGEASLAVETDDTIRADRQRLRQLLENLVRNCLEHGRGDDGESPDELTVTVGDLDGGFYVADDGTGIAPDERDQVREFGYSSAPDGTGFGLAIVEQIAGAHGWTFEITESEAGGARFEFRLDG